MHCPNNALQQLLELTIIDYSRMCITARDVTCPQSLKQLSNAVWCSFLLKRRQVGVPIRYMDEPQQRGGDNPSTLVSQIADCPAAIECLSKALIPSLLASLEVIVTRNRNELEGTEGEGDRDDSQRPGNQGINDQGHDNGHNDSGHPHSHRQYNHVPQLPGGAQRYQSNAAQHYQSIAAQHCQSNLAQQYEGSAAQHYQSIATQHSQRMQLSHMRAVQPSTIRALQLNTVRAMQPSHIGGI